MSIGDPAMDFADLLDSYGRAFVEIILASYLPERDTTFLQRASFYAGFMPFHEVLFGLIESDESHIQRGVKRIQQALAE